MPNPPRNPDLHGVVPDKCRTALLLIDVINDLDFPEGEQIQPQAVAMAKCLAALKKEAGALGIPAIYVNDNWGRWQSDFGKQVDHCLEAGSRGRELVELLRPRDEDYKVLKPKHSGFYSTTLDVLLDYLGCTDLIITGLAGNICVLYTANDAYMRDFHLHVPADCTASNTPEENEQALELMRKHLKADTTVSTSLDLPALARKEATGKAR